MRNDLDFTKIVREDKLILPKRYMSCSFVSIFDYSVQARGVEHTILRPVKAMIASQYNQIENVINVINVINDFCEANTLNRDEVWMCAKFSPFGAVSYQVSLYCVFRSERSWIGIEVRSVFRIYCINRDALTFSTAF